MSDKTKSLIYRVYGIVTSAMLVITGVLLILSCLSVYRIGNRPFTPENISSAFARISIPFYLTLTLVIIGVIFSVIVPQKSARLKALPFKKSTLTRLLARTDLSSDGVLEAKLKREAAFIIICRAVAAVLGIGACIPSLIYVLNVNNFTMEYDASIVAACAIVLPTAMVCVGLLLALSYVESASLDRQISLLKAFAAKTGKMPTEADKCEEKAKKRGKAARIALIAVRAVILLVAVFFIVEGVTNGGASDVLSKAINICTECIGLG